MRRKRKKEPQSEKKKKKGSWRKKPKGKTAIISCVDMPKREKKPTSENGSVEQ